MLESLVNLVIEKVGKPKAVAADVAYKTTSYLFNKEFSYRIYLIHFLVQKKEFLGEQMYTMCILILYPAGELLKYSTTNKKDYREYKSPNPAPLLSTNKDCVCNVCFYSVNKWYIYI